MIRFLQSVLILLRSSLPLLLSPHQQGHLDVVLSQAADAFQSYDANPLLQLPVSDQ